MSINDPIVVRWNDRHKFWYLTQGRETFYNEDRELLYWDDKEEAIEYSRKVLGKEPKEE